MWQNPQKTEELVTFTEEVLNGKLHFCAVQCQENKVFCYIFSLLSVILFAYDINPGELDRT